MYIFKAGELKTKCMRVCVRARARVCVERVTAAEATTPGVCVGEGGGGRGLKLILLAKSAVVKTQFCFSLYGCILTYPMYHHRENQFNVHTVTKQRERLQTHRQSELKITPVNGQHKALTHPWKF